MDDATGDKAHWPLNALSPAVAKDARLFSWGYLNIVRYGHYHHYFHDKHDIRNLPPILCVCDHSYTISSTPFFPRVKKWTLRNRWAQKIALSETFWRL